MKIGAIYDLAKQLYPSLTRRMFTQFYNMAMEQVSRKIRLNVVEEEYSDTTYSTIPATAVRIEEISCENGVYYWKIVDGALKLYDSEGIEVTDTTDTGTISIKYWDAIVGVIADAIYGGKFIDDSTFMLSYGYSETRDIPSPPRGGVNGDTYVALTYPEYGATNLPKIGILFEWKCLASLTESNFYTIEIYTTDGSPESEEILYFWSVYSAAETIMVDPTQQLGSILGATGFIDGVMDFLPSKTYYWRVRFTSEELVADGINEVVTTGWTFQIAYEYSEESPATPLAIQPLDADITSTTCVARVKPSDDLATYFEIDVNTANDFAAGTMVETATMTGTTSYTILGLTENTRYYYRFRAGNSYGESNSSESVTFVTDTVTIGDTLELRCNETSGDNKFTAVALDPITNTHGVEIISIGDIVDIKRYNDSDVVFGLYKLNKSDVMEYDVVYYRMEGSSFNVDFGSWRFSRFSLLWDEQDDGYDADAQMCAMYMALSNLIEFTAEPVAFAEMIEKRVAQWMHQLRIKYNSSQEYRSFKQVSF